jgi:hypothetical protein
MNPNDQNLPANQPPPPQPGIPEGLGYNPPGVSLPPGTTPLAAGHEQPHMQVVPKSNQNSTQNTLQISEIRDGIVIMNDGSFRTVLMFRSINFDLMSPEEREAVEFAYQNFLNSLYFEIQIYVRSTKVDIRPYLEKLDKIRSEHDNMLLAVLMEDYLDYIAALAEQTNIMDKKFYVTIPYYLSADTRQIAQKGKSFLETMFGSKEHTVFINEPQLEAAKTELSNRAQTVLSGLKECGVYGVALDTQELIELYYDSYNPDTATRQPLKNFEDMTAPIITKGQGQACQPQLDKELQ